MDINRFLERDVPECYFSMAMIQAAINHYILYETWVGEPQEEDSRTCLLSDIPGAEGYAERINGLMKVCYSGEPLDSGRYLAETEALRNEIKAAASKVACYTDNFRIYEYIINRTKPVDASTLKPMNNDAAARDILSGIFAGKDNGLINENIKLALSQLPLRMTKNRFFDILEEALRKYIDTDSSALERELYMIRSTSGLCAVEGEGIPKLDRRLELLIDTDYSNISEEDFAAAEETLKDAVTLLNDMSEFLQAAEQIVNLIMIMMMCYPRVTDSDRADVKDMTILTDEAVEGFETGIKKNMSPEALACLETLEGQFEPMADRLTKIQSRVSAAYKGNNAIETPAIVYELDKCERLLSPSVFAELEDSESHMLSEKEVLAEVKKLQNDFAAVLSGAPKIVNRARMAGALSQLPVFFDSRTDVMNYVRESLDGCRDQYEKMVAVNLLLDEMGH